MAEEKDPPVEPPVAPEPPPPEEEHAPQLELLDGGKDERARLRFGNGFASACEVLRDKGMRKIALGTDDPIRFDTMRAMHVVGAVPIDSFTVATMRENCERWIRYGAGDKRQALRLSKENVADALERVARENPFHPVKEYLDRLAKQPEAAGAIAEVGAKGLGTTDRLELTLLRKWAIGCVARAMQPGCKLDTVLVLVGPQGFRKSSFFQAIAGDEWFSDTAMNLESKDAIQQLHEAWIYEWGELLAANRKPTELVRGFITSRVDVYRAPYERTVIHRPRSVVIVATTNSTSFLNDPDGHRRWWPIRVTGTIDIDAVRALRDAFWNEAVHAYAFGHTWHLEDDDVEVEQLSEKHEDFKEPDSWADIVGPWLEKAEGAVTIRRVLAESGLAIRPQDMTKPVQMRAAEVLKALGWQKAKRRRSEGGFIVPWERCEQGVLNFPPSNQ